jgi:SAM-dependent methyltransferase
MARPANQSLEDRLVELLRYLGLDQAHFAACMPRDWEGILVKFPALVSSLTLVCPMGINPDVIRAAQPSLAVIYGDRGKPGADTARALANLPAATQIILRNYFSPSWADAAADRKDEIGAAMLEFLARVDARRGKLAATGIAAGSGEFADISYTVCGRGPALILLPIALSPSQWVPLIPALSLNYTTITLGGPRLGMVAHLEARAKSGYLRVIDQLFNEAKLKAGQSLLEVGCGSGAVVRHLAQQTQGRNRLVAMDINRYLLREAAQLTRRQGLDGAIEFQQGDAENLPFSAHRFDVSMACTVLEEGNADRMLAELVRVTKPGGRVAIVVRSIDMPRYVNLQLAAELKAKVESRGLIGGSVQEQGCADASLYRRMRQAGLVQVAMLPQWASHGEGERLQFMQERIVAALTPEEAHHWHAAARVQAEGTFFISEPFHCAVGTKP